MPFIKDTKNWNQRWDDDINYEGNGFTHIDEVQFDDEVDIVKFLRVGTQGTQPMLLPYNGLER
jgi:hypothetical protein